MHGFLNIDKPAGMTSHAVVAQVRRLASQRRVGHAGTLDPAATGVLVVALGTATRLIEYVQDHTLKGYRAVVRLGTTTATDDGEGVVVKHRDVPPFDRPALEAALMLFRGAIQQVPPMYSALHHNGERLYELARRGESVNIPARTVLIRELTLLDWQPPDVTLNVLCGKGTYIRSLARDLGAALGCGAHLHALRRTAVGAFRIEDAVALDKVTSWHGDTVNPDNPDITMSPPHFVTLSQILLPPDLAVADWQCVNVDEATARRIRNGQALHLSGLHDARARAHGPDGVLLALLEFDGDEWRPTKVFDWT